MPTRREFLVTTACTVAAAGFRPQGQSTVRVALSIPTEATGPRMPSDFVGLSYEVQQLADPTFFSAQNSSLIREFKALSLTGVLRLGGNTRLIVALRQQVNNDRANLGDDTDPEGR